MATAKKKTATKKAPTKKAIAATKPTGVRFLIQKTVSGTFNFCLELGNSLTCWNMIFAPTLDPDIKRRITPIDHQPPGNYELEGPLQGYGSVIIWDRGTYTVNGLSASDKNAIRDHINNKLDRGQVSINLSGERLQGRFTILATKSRGNNTTWFLVKDDDEYADDTDLEQLETSIISGMTVEDESITEDDEDEDTTTEDEEEYIETRSTRKQSSKPSKAAAPPERKLTGSRPKRKPVTIHDREASFILYERTTDEDDLLCMVRFEDMEPVFMQHTGDHWALIGSVPAEIARMEDALSAAASDIMASKAA